MSTSNKNNAVAEQETMWIADYKASGNLALLGEIYQPYMPLVYGVGLKYLKDEAKSKDAVMQIFEILIDKLKTHEVIHFKSWLYVLSKNHCLMQLRKEHKNIVVDLNEAIMEFEPFLHHDNAYEREKQLITMEKCIKKLNEEQKVSISLFYLEQKCYAEVADNTGYDINKVKSYIQNGKRNLKICIEKSSE